MRTPSLAALLLLLLTGASPAQDKAPQPTLLAGSAAVDITPQEFPLNMPGGFRDNIADRAHDPFFARAVVLADADTTLAMVVVDSLGAAPEVLQEAKEIAAGKTGIPTSRMLICSTHTHSGPPSNRTDGPPPAVAYRSRLVEGLAESIVQAHTALEPAEFGAAAHPLPDEVRNRRWYLKPGKMPLNPFGKLDEVKMNPGYSPNVLDRPAGPIDPDITVISIRDRRRKPLALFANYSLHYVGGIPKGQLSADYFGEFARLMPNRLRAGDRFVAMMSNGTSGDINNLPFLINRPPREPFEQVRIVARKAADTAWMAYQKIDQHRADVPIDMRQREITLSYRRPSEQELAAAKQVLALNDDEAIARLPRLAQNYARRTVSAAERKEDQVTVKLQAIRIGDLAVCAIPFETFAEIGLELKDRSPFGQTMVIGLANGRYGYLPTPRQHRLGGYETWLGTNKVQQDASDILIKNLIEMLAELKDDPEDAGAASAAATSRFLIGNSLTWDTVPSRLDGLVAWHVDCGKSLPYIVENPAEPCVKSSTLWPTAFQRHQYDLISIQAHYGSTLEEDLAAIANLIEKQPQAEIIIHTGWARAAERSAEWQLKNRAIAAPMKHNRARGYKAIIWSRASSETCKTSIVCLAPEKAISSWPSCSIMCG